MVVPGDSHLEIEAMVLNRDIGFVQAGQDAQIKIDTFNFSRYGLRWAVLPLLDGAAVKRGEIENGIVIAVHSNSFHTVRGRTLVRSAASRTSFNEAAAVMPRKIGLSIHPHPATRLASMRPRLAMPRKMASSAIRKRPSFASFNEAAAVMPRKITAFAQLWVDTFVLQ